MIKEILRVEMKDKVGLLKIEANTDDFLDVILSLQKRGYKVSVITEKEYDALRTISIPAFSAK